MMAVSAMRNHTADAGWQLQIGLESAGYKLCGPGFDCDYQNTIEIVRRLQPSILIVQDKREWMGLTAGQHRNARSMQFKNIHWLKERNDFFKMTVLKDAQQNPEFHADSANEMCAHGWITYYHPDIVKHVAPYVRKEHLVRTYHSVNANDVLEFSSDRKNRCIISGAISKAYPLRSALINPAIRLPKTDRKLHPGYHANGCCTPDFLKLLSTYKVAICTSSVYGYSLRKIIEAVCCGCIVITDLPECDQLPIINNELVRVESSFDAIKRIKELIPQLIADYDPERQQEIARRAIEFYDYRSTCKRLAIDIENLRREYNAS